MSMPLEAPEVLNREFLEIRARLLQIAAALDRFDRADGDSADDPRLAMIGNALDILHGPGPGRAEQIQLVFSRPYEAGWKARFDRAVQNPPDSTITRQPCRCGGAAAHSGSRENRMYYFDPHIHMVSRVTDDYEMLAKMGCVGMSEPAFWAGFDRGTVDGFRDYFRQLTEFEPKRAGWYRVQHYTWLCINAKEAENVSLAREVIRMIPEFIDRPGVLGIGEIGLNKNTKNEATVFCEHLDLAMATNEQILIHTPHLEDKYQGTRMILDMLCDDRRIDHNRVLVDHVEEHTIRAVLDQGFWAGMTLYPVSKCTPERAVDMVEIYGPQRLLVNSAGDWGPSKPTAVPDFMLAMRLRGHPESLIRQIVYENPLKFFSQSRNFEFTPPEVYQPAPL